MKLWKWAAFLWLIVNSLQAVSAGPKVVVEARSDAIVSGIHVTFQGRKLWEQQLNSPGYADLTAYVFELKYREMADRFDQLGCELQFYDYPFIPFDDYYARDDMSFIRVKVTNGAVEQALSLLGELRNKVRSVDEKDLKRASGNCVMSNRMRGSLGTLAGQKLRDVLFDADYPDQPMYFSGKPDLKKLHQFISSYTSTDNMIVTVVGDVSGETVKATAKKAFKDSGEQKSEFKMRPARMTKDARHAFVFESKRRKQGYVLISQQLRDNINEKQLAEAVLFSGVVSDVISFQLREREGLAYSIGAGVRDIGGHYFIVMYMGTSPETVRQSDKRLFELWEQCLEEGVDSATLDRIRNKLLIHRLMRRLTNINKAADLGCEVMWNRTPGLQERLDNLMKKMDITDLANVEQLFAGKETHVLVNPVAEVKK